MAKDRLTLKWGTLKAWHFETEECRRLLQQYVDLGSSVSAMAQRDTPEQKALICQMIDACDCEQIYLDWDGEYVTKEAAKKYVMEY